VVSTPAAISSGKARGVGRSQRSLDHEHATTSLRQELSGHAASGATANNDRVIVAPHAADADVRHEVRLHRLDPLRHGAEAHQIKPRRGRAFAGGVVALERDTAQGCEIGGALRT
jgi:hypothetical protein